MVLLTLSFSLFHDDDNVLSSIYVAYCKDFYSETYIIKYAAGCGLLSLSLPLAPPFSSGVNKVHV